MSIARESLEPLREFGIDVEIAEPAAYGGLNRHWTVSSAGRRLVLRRYNSIHGPDAIAWEHDLLKWLAGNDWPVALPMQALGGGTSVSLGDAHYSLFPGDSGEPITHSGVRFSRIAGRLLARLHADLAAYAVADQRPGHGRAWELDLFVEPLGMGSFNQVVRRFGADFWDLSSRIKYHRYRNLRELSRLGYGDASASVVHTNFRRENLTFSGGELTGIRGLDAARLDTPAFDVAAGMLGESPLRTEDESFEASGAEAFLSGYRRHRELDQTERQLVPALVRSHLLWLIAARLIEWAQTGSRTALAQIDGIIRNQLPALEGATPAFASLLKE